MKNQASLPGQNGFRTMISTLALLKTLYAVQRDPRGKALLLFGACRHPILTARWLQYLSRRPALWNLAQIYPRFGVKIFRPYLSRRLTCAERIAAMMQHYELMLHSGFMEFVKNIAAAPKILCEFSGKSGTAFQIEISASDLHNREGEFFLHLISNKVSLYHAAFSFVGTAGKVFVKVGCLQGVRAQDGAAFIRSATREFFGARPKNLLISVVRDIGHYFGCQGVIGIGNENRILTNGGRHEATQPNYDQTWEEMGAERRVSGNFEMPCVDILKTSFDEIPSKKRAEAKRKTALLDLIFRMVRESLDRERKRVQPVRDKALRCSSLSC